MSKDESIPKYTVLLPTYNEKENLPVCVWLIEKYMKEAEFSYEVLIFLCIDFVRKWRLQVSKNFSQF